MATVLDDETFPGSTWSSTNINEAFPGVLTPLSWSVWGPATERATRRAFRAIGLLRADEVSMPATTRDRLLAIVCGRPALRVEFFCEIGNRMPGASATAIAEQMFSCTPAHFTARPTRRFYPSVARRLPMTFWRSPRTVRRLRPEVPAWWSRSVSSVDALDEAGARAMFDAALERYEECAYWHVVTLFSTIQPVFDLVTRVAESAGADAGELMRGHGGHEETDVVDDLWRCSREQLTVEEFLGRHGYHGPWEGELSATVWREDPRPVTDLVTAYRRKPEEANPADSRAAGVLHRRRAEQAFLGGLPRWQRLVGRAVLWAGARYVPLRGIGKVLFLQSFDVARAAARRLGEHLAARGALAVAEDVFYLTADELRDPALVDVTALVAQRRAERAGFEAVELPTLWEGGAAPAAAVAPDFVGSLVGVGASSGVVEGRIRVVHDPAETEVDEGDILVARTTDPSWASVMFLASALVVDVGGQLSHAAVVARELGIPCVMNTLHGTRYLHDGDWCRVDGYAGRVDVLKPHDPATRKD